MPSPSDTYLDHAIAAIEAVRDQREAIDRAADWCSETILGGRMVHLFGSGHSRIMVEEMWPRYGSFPGFNPIVELSLTFHNTVVGANGQRQAMFLENVPGLAARILRVRSWCGTWRGRAGAWGSSARRTESAGIDLAVGRALR